MSPAGRSNIRLLLPDQSRELLDVHVRVAERPSSAGALENLVEEVASIVGMKVALIVKEDGVWSVIAEAGEGAPGELPDGLDTIADAPDITIERWTSEKGEDWTVIGLSRRAILPSVLLVYGDWTLSASTWEQFGRNLLLAELAFSLSVSARVRVAAHRLTRALSRASGFQSVAHVAVRNAALTIRAEIATLAVADLENETLQIMATHGYPVALVEHLRIPRGTGVLGKVYETARPLYVRDVNALKEVRRRRTRYRTDSFAAAPITAGHDVLGVMTVTDRVDGRPFTGIDLSALRTLAAPVGLALARERALAQAESYAQAAAIDPVSGLFNRRYFHARLDEELQRAHRHALSVGLLMIDVDDFKTINDTFGHLVGDGVIREIADILRRSVRVFDVCTRFGGEEFAVVMPGSGADDAFGVAERIRERISAYTSSDRALSSLKVTVSIGFAVSSATMTARDLINDADLALYHAKRAGKNQVRGS